jgi:hypothetical protein
MLTNEQLKRHAPAVFATSPAETVSGRYRFASTFDALKALEAEGVVPVRAFQSGTRVTDQAHAKHMVVLRPRDFADARAVVGELVPEIVITNAHTNRGGCAWSVYAAIFRFTCANGATVSVGDFESVRITHSSRQIENVLEGVFEVVDISRQAAEACMGWKGTVLSPVERVELATRALKLRWESNPPVDAHRLLEARRWEDAGADLFVTYQTIQEHLTKGLRSQIRGRRAPRINDINAIGLNKKLFSLAAEYAR